MIDLARHFNAAQGYLELGMIREAVGELESIDPASRELPAVVSLRISLYFAMEKWTSAESDARQMVKSDPAEPGWWVQWAYATRRCRSIGEARQILLDAGKQHPQDATIQFNLGCYACQMGNLEEAGKRVEKAISLDSRFREMAADDPDLAPLREKSAL